MFELLLVRRVPFSHAWPEADACSHILGMCSRSVRVCQLRSKIRLEWILYPFS